MPNSIDYAALFDASPYPALLLDRKMVIIDANPAFLSMVGRTTDVVGQSIFAAFPSNPDNPESTNIALLTASIEQAIATRVPHTTPSLRYAIPRITSEGTIFEERYWSTVHTPVLGKDGMVAYIAQTVIDITDLYLCDRHAGSAQVDATLTSALRSEGFNRAQMHEVMKRILHEERTHFVAERARAEEALREADRRKDEFLAMLAHELRNPLAPISAAAQLLKLPALNAGLISKTSAVISRQVSHMTSLIDDLLDVSRVTRGLISLDRKRLLINDVVNDAVEQVRPLIDARRQGLFIGMPVDSIALIGDHKRLVQVLTNLLNNAAKYTPEGGQLRLIVTSVDTQASICVQDDGIGIAPELLPRIFDLFTQAERTPDRSQGGLGLGLALVRSLVALHGGTVSAASPGRQRGASFSVALPRIVEPVEKSMHPLIPLQKAECSKGLRLLVVDDNTDAAEMLGAFMESAGHQVSIEYEPYQAMERARTEAPDVCLLDIGLPGMDGNQLARCLRRMPQMSNATLIAVTGYGKKFDRDASIAAGFDYYFVKPADPAELVALLDKLQTH